MASQMFVFTHPTHGATDALFFPFGREVSTCRARPCTTTRQQFAISDETEPSATELRSRRPTRNVVYIQRMIVVRSDQMHNALRSIAGRSRGLECISLRNAISCGVRSRYSRIIAAHVDRTARRMHFARVSQPRNPPPCTLAWPAHNRCPMRRELAGELPLFNPARRLLACRPGP